MAGEVLYFLHRHFRATAVLALLIAVATCGYVTGHALHAF